MIFYFKNRLMLCPLPRCCFGVIKLKNDERKASERTTDPTLSQQAKSKLAITEKVAISDPGAWFFGSVVLILQFCPKTRQI